MEYIHIKNLEKFHPGYKDRSLQWAKIYFKMVQGDPDCEMITNEVDWGRLIKFILLELEAQKPLPLNNHYLSKKGFNLKKRPIVLTLQVLHNFIQVIHKESETCVLDKSRVEKSRVDKEEEEDVRNTPTQVKDLFLEFVYLTSDQHSKLVDKFGIAGTEAYLHRLNDYIGSKGTKYRSHYHTILNWSRRDPIAIDKTRNLLKEKGYVSPYEEVDKDKKKKAEDILKSIKIKGE